MKWTRLGLVPLLAAILTLTGCGPQKGGVSEKTGVAPRVAGTLYPLAFVAQRVAGEENAADLVPAGVEPHDFEPSVGDVETLSKAQLVLYIAAGFQPSVEKALAAMAQGRPERFNTLSGINPIFYHDRGVGGGAGVDPHFWLDPIRLAQTATETAERLADLDLLDADQYRRGASSLVAELERLDQRYQKGLKSCARRTLVTTHASFGYLAMRYDLTPVAIAGSSPESEPSAGRLGEVVVTIRQTGTKVVFAEPLAGDRAAAAVASETGAAVATLDPIEGLTKDAAARGENYISIMDANLVALRQALDCA